MAKGGKTKKKVVKKSNSNVPLLIKSIPPIIPITNNTNALNRFGFLSLNSQSSPNNIGGGSNNNNNSSNNTEIDNNLVVENRTQRIGRNRITRSNIPIEPKPNKYCFTVCN